MRSREPKRRLNSVVAVGLFKEDYDRLKRAKLNSVCRTMSEYCRKLLLGKPIRVYYRDQSFDAFVGEAIELRKEMEKIREGGTFSPEGERQLIALQEEIKKCINKIFDHVRQNRKGASNS